MAVLARLSSGLIEDGNISYASFLYSHLNGLTRRSEADPLAERVKWRPSGSVLAIVLSVNNVPIRLTEERWWHITAYHEELANFQREILLTVAEPNMLFYSPHWARPCHAAVKAFPKLRESGLPENLVVHYREVTPHDGFILTAFAMSNKRIEVRFGRWRRLR
ncbi:MAG: hypothetical protein AOA65_2041 [Candidatus Bathyarchaeota archaeon BA1]|nr:MAG: hypothetical protein AOA65_2041 [Candidatus Bathyarchaeota archaeon BA1]